MSYGETVCCGGIDLETHQWIRLYPVPFRDLENNQRFRKYDLIRANCAKATDDHRKESFRIQAASIKIIGHLATEDKWKKRIEIVYKAPRSTLCELLPCIEDDVSFGLVKPASVSFELEPRSGKKPEFVDRAYSRPGLFDKPKQKIENIPYQFYYRFRCFGITHCPGHRLPITDWEINQAYRDWRSRYESTTVLLKMIEQKWMKIVDPESYDSHLFIGNMHKFRDQFVVLGVFYPPR